MAKKLTHPTTCQICGRPIKANTGRIAHHGYKRPHRGSGWQTASCLGALAKPYEESRDRIPYVLGLVKDHIEHTRNHLQKIKVTPPDTVLYKKYHGAWNAPELIDVARPADFNVATARDDYKRGSYANVYFALISDLEDDIKGSGRTLEALQARYDNWKAPAVLSDTEMWCDEFAPQAVQS